MNPHKLESYDLLKNMNHYQIIYIIHLNFLFIFFEYYHMITILHKLISHLQSDNDPESVPVDYPGNDPTSDPSTTRLRPTTTRRLPQLRPPTIGKT